MSTMSFTSSANEQAYRGSSSKVFALYSGLLMSACRSASLTCYQGTVARGQGPRTSTWKSLEIKPLAPLIDWSSFSFAPFSSFSATAGLLFVDVLGTASFPMLSWRVADCPPQPSEN